MRIIPSLVILSALLGSCTQLPTVSVDPIPTPPEIVPVQPVHPRCVPTFRPTDWEALVRTFTEQRARWNALGQVNYAYTARVDSLLQQPPTRIEVRDNQVVSATVIATGQPVSAEGLRGYRTIDQFYAYYAGVIEHERANPETCVAVDITFDPAWPIPREIDYRDMTRGVQDALGIITLTDYAPRP